MVFWKNGCPSLDFIDSEIMTFKGENLLDIRSDVTKEDLKVYILAFYRILKPEDLCKNLRDMKPKEIKELYMARIGRIKVIQNNEVQRSRGAEIPFNYAQAKEKNAIQLPNAGRLLACLLLSKSFEACDLPYDPFEAKQFFQNNFKGTVEEILDKYCEERGEDKSILLSYYRNIANRNRAKRYPPERDTKKFSTVDLLCAAFAQLTK